MSILRELFHPIGLMDSIHRCDDKDIFALLYFIHSLSQFITLTVDIQFYYSDGRYPIL